MSYWYHHRWLDPSETSWEDIICLLESSAPRTRLLGHSLSSSCHLGWRLLLEQTFRASEKVLRMTWACLHHFLPSCSWDRPGGPGCLLWILTTGWGGSDYNSHFPHKKLEAERNGSDQDYPAGKQQSQSRTPGLGCLVCLCHWFLRTLRMDLKEKHVLSSCDMSDNVISLPSMTLIIRRPEGAPKWGKGQPSSWGLLNFRLPELFIITLHPKRLLSWCYSKSNPKFQG